MVKKNHISIAYLIVFSYKSIQCSTIQYSGVHYSTVLYSTVQYYT